MDLIYNSNVAYGTYHYCSNPVTTWHDFAKAIINQASGVVEGLESPTRVEPITTADYPTPAQRPGNSSLDCQKIKEHCNIEQPSWQEALDLIF